MEDEKFAPKAIFGVNFDGINEILEVVVTGGKTFGDDFSYFPNTLINVLVHRYISFLVLVDEQVIVFLQAEAIKCFKFSLDDLVSVLLAQYHICDELDNLEDFPLLSHLVKHAGTKADQILKYVLIMLGHARL